MRFHSYPAKPLKPCQLWFAALFLFLVLFLGSCVPAKAANQTNAGNVKLAWDASADDYRTNGVTYSLTASNAIAGVTNIAVGTNLTASITNLDAGRWVFFATAKQGGIESLPSNLVYYDVPTTRPTAPGQNRILFLDSTLDFVNWYPFAGFRLRLP
jgi:hypothetical protein